MKRLLILTLVAFGSGAQAVCPPFLQGPNCEFLSEACDVVVWEQSGRCQTSGELDLSRTFVLHIEAGFARDTLSRMSRQTETELMYGDYDWVSVRPTRAVQGRYSVFQGFCALLEGSGMSFERLRNSVLVFREEHPGERDQLCQDKPSGWGPDFIHPPVADWK